MHYYQHHIGDFIKATARLSDSQTMAYLRLLWMYYDSEKPLKPDARLLAFQIGSSIEDTELLLESFFVLCADGWHQTRCDQEIADYHAHIAKKSNAGKASAERRKNSSSTPVQQVLDSGSASVQLTTNHKPLTTNQDIEIEEANASKSGSTFPTCPQQDILKLWEKHLPHLAQPRIWEGNRKAMLRQRWVQAGKPSTFSKDGYKTASEGLEWWSEFFDYIANHTKLANGFESQGRTWRPDLEWVVTASNFQKIIDGKYDK